MLDNQEMLGISDINKVPNAWIKEVMDNEVRRRPAFRSSELGGIPGGELPRQLPAQCNLRKICPTASKVASNAMIAAHAPFE